MSSLATIRADVENDLKDTGNTLWTDAEINRAIYRALQDYSHASPIEQKSTLPTAPNSRNVSLATLTPRIRVVAAEYPTGEYPPQYVPFTIWGDTLTLDLISAPSGTPNVDILWHKEHAINGSVTFPTSHDNIISTGAAGYAALAAAAYAANRVNVGGDNTWGRYQEFGRSRLAAFEQMLRTLPAASRLNTSQLYSAIHTRLTSQTTDPGPV